MTSRADGPGRRAPGVRVQHRATELARDEAARLSDDIQLTVAALSVLGDRTRDLSRTSARVRALGLEALPNSDYLVHCVRALRAGLDSPRPGRRWISTSLAGADEVQAMLERAIALTATIDVPGELGLALDLVTATQTGARAGIASLSRLRDSLVAVETEPYEADRARAGDARPSRSAQWLVRTASLLLPAGSRDRYGEEFSSELRELAGSRAQLAHAVRLVSRVWALRNALPVTASPPAAGPDRVRVHPRADSAAAVRPPSTLQRLQSSISEWFGHHEARVVMRLQARAQRRQDFASRYHRAGHQSRIIVNHRHHRRSSGSSSAGRDSPNPGSWRGRRIG